MMNDMSREKVHVQLTFPSFNETLFRFSFPIAGALFLGQILMHFSKGLLQVPLLR